MAAIKNSGHQDKVELAMDVAASEFYSKDNNNYDLDFKNDNNNNNNNNNNN